MHNPFDSIDHRLWPLPSSPWVMTQTWLDLLFMHWAIPVEQMRKAVPSALPLDTYDGQAWIAVVPFRMSGVRPRMIPSVPRLSAFPELNVRTYVTLDNKPGVYFFSLEAGNPLAVQIARTWFHLPYFHAEMSLKDTGEIRYQSHRIHGNAPPADFRGTYRPTGDVYRSTPGSLEHWLTERYCLYTTDAHQNVYRAEIHHVPWPLQPATAEIEVNSMTEPHGLSLPDVPPLLHFARRLKVAVWPLKRISP